MDVNRDRQHGLPRRRKHRLPDQVDQARIAVAVTMCMVPRKPVLIDPALVEVFTDYLGKACDDHHCTAPIYTFMPDHIHTILLGKDDEANVLRTLRAFKINTGRWLKYNRPRVRYQKDFYDSIIQLFEGWTDRSWFIANNPVRSRLVTDFRDWPFTGSVGHDIIEILSER